jgi:predicted phosphodiesterase
MKIALLSDVHSNLHALDAVLTAIGAADVDATYHLGDLVGYSAFPNEVIERIRERGIAGVAGNYDSTVATHAPHCGCRSENPAQEALAHESFAWTLAHTSAVSTAWLGTLPFRLDLKPLGGHARGPQLTLVHGTPTLNTVYWTADRDDDFCRKMATLAGLVRGDVIAFGHTHKPWTRVVDGVTFVNTGSVGRPKDGDPRAGFILLDLSPEGAAVQFVRVDYDVSAAADAVIKAGLPAAFADFLKAGGEPAAVRA